MANLPPQPGRLVLHIFIQTASKRRQQVSETPAVAGRYSAHVATSSWSMESAVSFLFWNGFACKLFVVGCYAGVGVCSLPSTAVSLTFTVDDVVDMYLSYRTLYVPTALFM